MGIGGLRLLTAHLVLHLGQFLLKPQFVQQGGGHRFGERKVRIAGCLLCRIRALTGCVVSNWQLGRHARAFADLRLDNGLRRFNWGRGGRRGRALLGLSLLHARARSISAVTGMG